MKRLLTALLSLSVLISSSSCTVRIDNKAETNDISLTPSTKAAAEVATAEETEEAEETAVKAEKATREKPSDTRKEDDSSEADEEEDFMSGYVSEERSMEIAMMQRTKPDSDGFIIRDGTVYDYDGIEPEIHIPDGVTKISEQAFWSNDIIEAVYIPSSVKTIGQGAFWSCSGLKYVKADEGLEKIGGSAFWSCSGLETVELPASVNLIGDSVFWAIDDITVHAPAGSYAEEYCMDNGIAVSAEAADYTPIDRANTILASQYAHSDFTEFTIGENIVGIESDAFEYCKKLESIFIPSNVQYIAPDAFEYCYGLQTVTVDGCREIKGEAFEYCKGLTEVRINEGTESIGSSAFAYCESLTDVYLPESVSSIDKSAFEYTGDLTLHVPAGSYAERYAISMKIPYDNNN